jgi:hypothetical protein
MRQRVEMLHGTLGIASRIGQGAEIRATIPFVPSEHSWIQKIREETRSTSDTPTIS